MTDATASVRWRGWAEGLTLMFLGLLVVLVCLDVAAEGAAR
jgi:hypothetical protein